VTTTFAPGELSEADVLALSSERGEPDWLRDRRQEAFKAFADLEWPHKRMEAWRMTDPARFDLANPVVRDAGPAPAQPASIVRGAGDAAASAVLSDTGLCEVDPGDTGVVIADLSQAADGERADVVQAELGHTVGAEGKFEALSLAAFTGGALVYIPPEVELDRPVTLTVHVDAPGTHLPRVLVVADHHAHASVYVAFTGNAEATVVDGVEMVARQGANLDVVTAQQWGLEVDQISTRRGRAGRDARYRHLEATLGGGIVYLRPDVELAGEGAAGELLGVYFVETGQHVEHRSLIDHTASHTSSEALYKGALQGDCRAAWYGNIRIEANAKQTSSDETNRNLILTDDARADSIPWLEILTSDVAGCGHHSSIGQIDELQLFYLESRGIPRAEALQMLVFGFFSEVTDRIELPGVTPVVLEEIASTIDREAIVLTDPRRSG
jgi:Fe-S cluster assembly protein SufD